MLSVLYAYFIVVWDQWLIIFYLNTSFTCSHSSSQLEAVSCPAIKCINWVSLVGWKKPYSWSSVTVTWLYSTFPHTYRYWKAHVPVCTCYRTFEMYKAISETSIKRLPKVVLNWSLCRIGDCEQYLPIYVQLHCKESI